MQAYCKAILPKPWGLNSPKVPSVTRKPNTLLREWRYYATQNVEISNIGLSSVEERDAPATKNAVPSSSLGIPSIEKWEVPPSPQNLTDWTSLLSSDEVQSLVQSPSSAMQLLYGFSRTTFFLAQGFYAANTINYRSKQGIFKDPPRNPQEIFETLTVKMSPSLRSIAELYRRDAENVHRGYYKLPYDMDPRHRQWNPNFVRENFNQFVDFARDVNERMKREGRTEVKETSDEARRNGSKYPEYYLQNFHFQDGWLSEFSAKSYEVATETLFYGSQDAMQRGSLIPLHFFLKGKSEKEVNFLEIACGTGRYLTFVKDNYPGMKTTATDLSPFYLDKAKENMDYFQGFDKSRNPGRNFAQSEFLQAAAENLPFEDSSFDVISCTYLFHELPPSVREEVVMEMARLLKSGGIVIFNDSIQRKDRPEIDFSYFPENYHEPYYPSYVETDLEGLFRKHGFNLESTIILHVSKILTFLKV